MGRPARYEEPPRPPTIDAVVFAGVVYPVVFGAVGGGLAHATSRVGA